MSNTQREPCPRCGEPAALFAKACPFCGGSLLVDVLLNAPVADSRARYRLAREISSLGPPAVSFSDLQRSLGSSRPVLARGVSRQSALRFGELLAEMGLRTAIEPERSGDESTAERSSRLAAVGLGGLALLALLLWMWPESGGAIRPAVPRRPDDAFARARTVSWPTPSQPLSERELQALVGPSVLQFRSGSYLASGFFVAPGIALARTDAVQPEFQVVLAGGRVTGGEVVKRDYRLGLALVHVPEAKGEPLELGDAATAGAGERVRIPGSVMKEGTIGPAVRKLRGIVHLVLEGSLELGDDGAPVIDAHGRVLGLAVVLPDGAWLLPIDYAYLESNLVEPPRPAPDRRRWKELLAQVEATEALRVVETARRTSL